MERGWIGRLNLFEEISVVAKSGTNDKRQGVTKKEIVKSISEKTGATQLSTKAIVQETFNAIIDALVTGKRVELRNFGVFDLKIRAARRARNPRTGEQVDVPAKIVVTFKPGKEMEERVHQVEPVLWSLMDGEEEPEAPAPDEEPLQTGLPGGAGNGAAGGNAPDAS